MSPSHRPIFYSESGRRWRLFRSILRVTGVVAIVVLSVVSATIVNQGGVSLPRFRGENEIIKRVLNPEKIANIRTVQNTQFKRSADLLKLVNPTADASHPGEHPPFEPVRAGFYVNWDAQSYYSLKRNIDRLNRIFPEWLFVPDAGFEVAATIDTRALELMRQHGVQIVPMISNFYNNEWSGKNVDRIISRPENRKRFIESIVDLLKSNDFQGINIDFEELIEKNDDHLVAFQKELYARLHSEGLIVTQDVAPFNDDYDLAVLGKFNDALVLMAYDMHYAESNPGPVADLAWIEHAIEDARSKLPGEKIILGLGAYGYDWPSGSEGNDITYQEAVVTAKESTAAIQFDSNSSNLTYTYSDDDDLTHTVWFTDAALALNTLRIAQKFDLAGAAVWRLGSEDGRLWEFFDRTLQGPPSADISALGTLEPTRDLDYEGEGEVLDVVATPAPGKIDVSQDEHTGLIAQETYQELPSSYVIKKFGKGDKKIVLTFDDGPDERYTPAILDILKQEKVPAAFFLVGINAENNLPLVKRIYDEGHELGNHTFTHPNLAEVTPERASLELKATGRIIESVTGRSTILFRPPYNADSEPETAEEIMPVTLAKDAGYYTIGESIDPRDWEQGITANQIMERIKTEQDNGSILLLHDAGGDRSQTVEALPRIIGYFRSRGYTFTTISDLVGTSRDTVMPPLPESERMLARINWTVAYTIYFLERIFSFLFLCAIILAILRTFIIAVLAIVQRKREMIRLQAWKASSHEILPPVTVVIPAFNEEVTVIQTVESVLKSDYPGLEVIVVDDGSTDSTLVKLQSAVGDEGRVRIVTKPNGGKATALNLGVEQSSSEFVICIDADTKLPPTAVRRLMRGFRTAEVGAVSGNVKVGNEVNLMTRWQAIEYVTSQNFDRRAFELLNSITVVPGSIGAFRKSALLSVGGFSTDTLAEDCDVTMNLLEAGFVVTYESKAYGYTEAPETVKQFLNQRFRWTFGIMQSTFKHRRWLFSRERWNLGFVAVPNSIIFQFALPLISPFVDLLMLLSLLGGYWERVGVYYIVFTAVDALGAVLSFSLERERLARLWLLIPQRLAYRQLLWIVVVQAVLSAIRGRIVSWGKLVRTGNANSQLEPASAG